MIPRRVESWLPEPVEDWGRSVMGRPRHVSRGPSTGLLIAGAAAIGLAYLTWTYLGPDLRRYMKIHSM
jgi:hypothetical protein